MNITYDYYRIFYYVAKYQSFTLAANALYSSQPNITRAIKNLENDIGCTLFIRSNKGVELTPEGEKLYAHISVAFEHIQAGEEELSLEKTLQSGLISISATEIALHCLMLPVLRSFHKTYPGIRIRISNHSTPQALNSLKIGLSDIAVVTSPVDASKPLKSISIKPIKEVAVCSSYFSELAGRKITLEELTKYPLISLGNQTKSYEFYSNYFFKYGLTLNAEIEAATTDQVLPMVKNDLGIGFVPMEFVENDIDKNNLIILDIKEKIPERNISLVKNTERPTSIVTKELEKIIADNRCL